MRMSYRRTRCWFEFLERRRFAQLNQRLQEQGREAADEAMAHAPHS